MVFINLTSPKSKCDDFFTLCAVHAHKHLSPSGMIECCLVSVVCGGVIMPAIMLGMNNTKLWHYVGLFRGDRNHCDGCSSDFPPEHSRFMAYEACICQDM